MRILLLQASLLLGALSFTQTAEATTKCRMLAKGLKAQRNTAKTQQMLAAMQSKLSTADKKCLEKMGFKLQSADSAQDAAAAAGPPPDLAEYTKKTQQYSQSLKEMKCTAKKGLLGYKIEERTACIRDALKVLSEATGAVGLEKCIPRKESNKDAFKAFNASTKHWKTENTIDYIAPDKAWSSGDKPIAKSGMAGCIGRSLKAALDRVGTGTVANACGSKGSVLSQIAPTIDAEKVLKDSQFSSMVNALKKSNGRDASLSYTFKWRKKGKYSSAKLYCGASSLQRDAKDKDKDVTWSCENMRSFQTDQASFGTGKKAFKFVMPTAADLKTLKGQKDALSKQADLCKAHAEYRMGHHDRINSLTGDVTGSSIIGAVISASTKDVKSAASTTKLSARLSAVNTALQRMNSFYTADKSRQSHLANDLIKICYGQSLGTWGEAVKYGSELDRAMTRKANRRDDADEVHSHLRQAHACKVAAERVSVLAGNFQLKASDGVPSSVTADTLSARSTKMASEEELVRGDDNARRCFLKLPSTSGADAITKSNLSYHLKRCTSAIEFLSTEGAPKKYPTSGKSKVQLESQKKKVQARYDAVEKIVQKQIVAGRAKRGASNCASYYNFFKMGSRYGMSKSKWMSCCKREIVKFSEDKKGGAGILLRKCGK